MDPERAHHVGIAVIGIVGRVPVLRSLVQVLLARGPAATVQAFGREVPGHVGLAAGFDKDARAVQGLAMLGFSHVEVGTVTAQAQPGNDRPRLRRLLESQALLNRMGFNNEGFGLVGEVRHRGVEGSVAGQLGANTSVVLGAVAFEPEVSGPLVDAGVVGSRAAGISQVVVNANVERQLGDDWSVDASLSYTGERWADTGNNFKTPSVTTLNIGARHKFELAGRPSEFRILGSNLTDVEGYRAMPSGVLTPIPARTVRALLTVTFGPKQQ
jgi:hypothetical protein